MTTHAQPSTRDPVCGMVVDPASAQHATVHRGTTWYFCAAGCQGTFQEDPERFAGSSIPSTRSRRTSLRHEVRWAAGLFAIIVTLVIVGRGLTITTETSATSRNATVIGSAAGRDQAVDDGSGGVITTVRYDRRHAGGEAEFTLALDTHTQDLGAFDPGERVHLQDGATELQALGFEAIGEPSSHHREYRVWFATPEESTVTLTVADLAGVAERQFPFTL